MIYRVVVYKASETIEQVYDRTFQFYESSHKVVDIMDAAVAQVEAEGGHGN